MLLVQDFLQTQQEAVALALEKNITYEDAVRIIAAEKEAMQKKRIALENQMLNEMGNSLVSSYDSVREVLPEIKSVVNSINS